MSASVCFLSAYAPNQHFVRFLQFRDEGEGGSGAGRSVAVAARVADA